jgi:hypothetical protein
MCAAAVRSASTHSDPPPSSIATVPSRSRHALVTISSDAARALRHSASASHEAGGSSPNGTATSTSRAFPGASSRSQHKAPDACAKSSCTRVRGGSSPRSRWRVTPPCSNAAAPNPVGAVERNHDLAAVDGYGTRLERELGDRARAAHALERLPRRRHLERPQRGEQPYALRGGSAVLDAVPHARARPSFPACERRGGEREIAPVPVRRRNRQGGLRERLRHVCIGPCDELAVGVQEGLEREARAVGLDHALFVHDRGGRPALDTDRCPVGL